MQITYAPKAWALEKASWKAVIQLNLIRSINTILDALATHLANVPQPSRRVASPPPSPPSPVSDDDAFAGPPVQFSSEKRNFLLKLSLRLAPLRQVEIDLKARLGDGTEEVTEANAAAQDMAASPFDDPQPRVSPRPSKEIVVRSHSVWKTKEKERKAKDRGSFRPTAGADADRDCATEVLAGCAEDMVALWTDAVVRDIVDGRGIVRGLGDSAE